MKPINWKINCLFFIDDLTKFFGITYFLIWSSILKVFLKTKKKWNWANYMKKLSFFFKTAIVFNWVIVVILPNEYVNHAYIKWHLFVKIFFIPASLNASQVQQLTVISAFLIIWIILNLTFFLLRFFLKQFLYMVQEKV